MGEVVLAEAAVDDERRERPRLGTVEVGAPAGCGPAVVEPRAVACDLARDRADPEAVEPLRQPLQVVGLQRRVAEALQHQASPPDAPHLLPFAEHGGVEPVSGAELDERAVGDRQLLVRGRLEGDVGVPGEDGLAGCEVDGHRRRLAGCDPGAAQGVRELPRGARRRRLRRGRSEQRDEAAERGQASPENHGQIVPEKSRSF